MSDDSDSAAEKSHEPTPRKLQQAREQGDLPRSQDAQTFAAYLGFGAAAFLGAGWAAERIGGALVPFLDRPAELARLATSGGAGRLTAEILGQVAPPAMAMVAAPAAVILALLIAQRGIVIAPNRIEPKFSRLSPVENARNKYGARGMVEFLKSAVKLGALGVVLAIAVLSEADRLPQYARVDARFAGALLDHQFGLILTGVLVLAAAIAVFDVLWQQMEYLRRNRMTYEELKKEGKESEGDPHMRAQRRERARQIASNRMLQDVPQADVVIANPTHYAVALRWCRYDGSAPVCIAKGVDDIALAIREKAEAAGVPVHGDPPTARALYAVVEIGHEIQPEHYQAVAAAVIFADEMRRKARAAQ